MGLRDLSAAQQVAALAAGETSSLELVDAHLAAVEADDVQAFLKTLQQARRQLL